MLVFKYVQVFKYVKSIFSYLVMRKVKIVMYLRKKTKKVLNGHYCESNVQL
jgi:hypothetical protein